MAFMRKEFAERLREMSVSIDENGEKEIWPTRLDCARSTAETLPASLQVIPCHVHGSLASFQSEMAPFGSVLIIFLNDRRETASFLLDGDRLCESAVTMGEGNAIDRRSRRVALASMLFNSIDGVAERVKGGCECVRK